MEGSPATTNFLHPRSYSSYNFFTK